MKKTKILVVDDEHDLCEILKYNFENEGFDVDVAYSAEEALKKNLDTFDILVLDVMMGGISGFKMAEIIRKDMNLMVPIIFLTAKDTENDLLTGFILGADDYVSKPFSVKQLIARVNAVLMRYKPNEKINSKIIVQGLVIDLESKKVFIDKHLVLLTKKEFDILKLLVKHKGRVFSREEIMDLVWQEDVVVGERTVDVNITRLRKKLGKYEAALVNRFGYGYCFDSQKI